MTRPRFTVLHGTRFERQLTQHWMTDPGVQAVMGDLEPVLRSIPEQAGHPFWFHEREYLSLVHRSNMVITKSQSTITSFDCRIFVS